jgi:peptidoglycan/LPS O-acetylase OafA/YrhL
LGVDVFFVLSGFLISSLLLEEHSNRGSISIRGFYARRALRLLPALYLMIIACFLFSQLQKNEATQFPLRDELWGVGSIVVYLANWRLAFTSTAAWGSGHLFSLGIEEQFYLIWPLILLALLWTRRRAISLAFVGVSIAVSAILMATTFQGPNLYQSDYVETQNRIGPLMLGAGLALLLNFGWKPPRWIGYVGLAGLGFITWILVTTPGNTGWLYIRGGFTLIAFAAGAILLAALDPTAPFNRIFTIAPLRYSGKISYSLYLWHVPVFFAVVIYIHGALNATLVALPLAILAANLSYYFVERPILRLRHPRAVESPIPSAVVPTTEGQSTSYTRGCVSVPSTTRVPPSSP